MIDPNPRIAKLSDRKQEHYHSCYRNLAGIQDLTSFLNLPTPGDLLIQCLIPAQRKEISHFNDIFPTHPVNPVASLFILPPLNFSATALKDITTMAEKLKTWIITRHQTLDVCYLIKPDGQKRQWQHFSEIPTQKDHFPMVSIGPAKVAIIPFSALRHPESVVAISKQGADLVVCPEFVWNREVKLLSGARTINHIAVAVCTRHGGGIWMRPEGHQRWQEKIAHPGERCSFTLDTSLTRQKKFQDRIDFNSLLAPNTS